MRNGPKGSYYREKKKNIRVVDKSEQPLFVVSKHVGQTCPIDPCISEKGKKRKNDTLSEKKKILKNGCTVRMNLSKASMINCYCSFCVFFFFFFLSSFYFVKNACPSTLFSEGTRTDRPVAFNPIHGKRKEEGKRRKGGIESSFDFHPFLFSLEREHFFFFFFLPA